MSYRTQATADLDRTPAQVAIPRRIVLREICSLDPRSQWRIREIRNEPSIRKFMYTDHEIQIDEHQNWLDRLKVDKCRIAFAVVDDSVGPIGMVSVNELDWRHRKADWAFYLTATERGGLGAALELTLLDFVFERLGLEKLNCEVIEGNDAVIRLHAKFGFEEEGFRRANIEKDGVRLGVHLLGLQRRAWLDRRDDVRRHHKAILEKFDVGIEWNGRGPA
jgi:UDP-4-amino-4,6-dideoxy-N-acetyl-beta-L-altrosamine N-acetyltransferase